MDPRHEDGEDGFAECIATLTPHHAGSIAYHPQEWHRSGMGKLATYLFFAHTAWAAIFFASFVGFNVASAWAFRRERNMARGETRDRGSRALIFVLGPIGMLIAFAAPPLAPGARMDLPPAPLFFTGIAMMWAGTALYPWAATTLGAFFRTEVQLLDGHRLVTSGLYRFVRHPAYLAGVLIFTGMGLAIGNWISLAALTSTTLLGYAWRIHVEEQALAERFDADWRAYRKRSWAILPPVW
jgi:protein-S-isoprenylcysteine O-methyltransferase Ste14